MISRRASKGRSDFLDDSIKILESMFRTKGNERFSDVQSLILNNSLPNELRSILWKVFLDVLPISGDSKQWVEITRKNKEKYLALNNDFKELETINKLLRKEIKESDLSEFKDTSIYKNYSAARQFLDENLSEIYDLFKNESLAETLIRNYIIFRQYNENFEFSHQPFLHILSAIIYSLYPCIIHHYEKIDLEESDTKSMFYFLNSEDNFDEDVYWIYDAILNGKKFKETILNINKETDLNNIKVVDDIQKINLKTVNKLEFLYVLLMVENPGLINHMRKIQADISLVFKYWVTTLFSSSFTLENLIYILDIILSYDTLSKDDLEDGLTQNWPFKFLYFVSASIVNELNNDLLKITDHKEFNDYLLVNFNRKLDFKQIISNAFDIREKISSLNNH